MSICDQAFQSFQIKEILDRSYTLKLRRNASLIVVFSFEGCLIYICPLQIQRFFKINIRSIHYNNRESTISGCILTHKAQQSSDQHHELSTCLRGLNANSGNIWGIRMETHQTHPHTIHIQETEIYTVKGRLISIHLPSLQLEQIRPQNLSIHIALKVPL